MLLSIISVLYSLPKYPHKDFLIEAFHLAWVYWFFKYTYIRACEQSINGTESLPFAEFQHNTV